ncbi:Uncharacterized protein SCF082_LOCUS24686 [Durusdinium trenchii]|uniref:Transposase n=1 Tax=Durusdinium trenchii TaxID=1381693 RepID=A0ABP0LYN8_9DINO
MPKLAMKYRSPWPVPKRGKSRAQMKRPSIWCISAGPHFNGPACFAPAALKGQDASEVGRKDLSSLWCGQARPFAILAREKELDAQMRSQVVQKMARSQHVPKKQKHIKFGAKHKWCNVEADEVDVSKEMEMQQNTGRWEQWGPIAKRDWKPVAKKFLEGRSVILHTDGAKAYKTKIPGVIHDNVVHKKKRIVVRGKAVGSAILARKVRAAQWTYWHRTQNLWAATGHMLEELRG